MRGVLAQGNMPGKDGCNPRRFLYTCCWGPISRRHIHQSFRSKSPGRFQMSEGEMVGHRFGQEPQLRPKQNLKISFQEVHHKKPLRRCHPWSKIPPPTPPPPPPYETAFAWLLQETRDLFLTRRREDTTGDALLVVREAASKAPLSHMGRWPKKRLRTFCISTKTDIELRM